MTIYSLFFTSFRTEIILTNKQFTIRGSIGAFWKKRLILETTWEKIESIEFLSRPLNGTRYYYIIIHLKAPSKKSSTKKVEVGFDVTDDIFLHHYKQALAELGISTDHFFNSSYEYMKRPL